MTENKRFVYYEHKGADYILDTPNTELDFIEMLGDALETEEIADKLNKLHEENEMRKEHQRTLENKIRRLKDRVKTFEKHYSLKDIERLKRD